MKLSLILGGVAAFVVMGALWLFARDPCPSGRTLVVGRLGDPPELRIWSENASVRKLGIGTATRSTVTLDSPQTLEVAVPADATHVRFSLAAVGTGSTSVAVEMVDGVGHVHEVRTIELEVPTPAWRDFELGIDAKIALPGKLRFRPSGPVPGSPRIHVGGVTLLGSAPCDWRQRLASRNTSLPNVVLISLDTLGADKLGLRANGAPITPFLDALRLEGADLRQAFASYPNTIVSHASLFTGLFPRHHQVYGGLHAMVRSTTLAELLGTSGYITAAFTEDAYVGSNFRFDRGFDSYDDGDHTAAMEFGGDAAATFRSAADWLSGRTTTAPVLLFIHTYEVHSPYNPRDPASWAVARSLMPEYEGMFAQGQHDAMAELRHNTGRAELSQQAMEFLKARHLGEADYLDRQVKELFLALRRDLSPDNTIIVVTADHGEEFGEFGRMGHGETLTDAVLRVPLFFQWPGKIRARVSEVPVALVDVLPTLLDLLGLPPHVDADGRSFARFLRGLDSAPAERPIFADLVNALGECRRAGQPDDCTVDWVSARTTDFKMVDSRVPHQTRMFDVRGGAEQEVAVDAYPREAETLRELIQFYRGLSPLKLLGEGPAPSVDKPTEERLRALGYL